MELNMKEVIILWEQYKDASYKAVELTRTTTEPVRVVWRGSHAPDDPGYFICLPAGMSAGREDEVVEELNLPVDAIFGVDVDESSCIAGFSAWSDRHQLQLIQPVASLEQPQEYHGE